MMEVLANATVVIILQYINVSNEHLKLPQCYMSIISQPKKKVLIVASVLCWMILGRAQENRALPWAEGSQEGRAYF